MFTVIKIYWIFFCIATIGCCRTISCWPCFFPLNDYRLYLWMQFFSSHKSSLNNDKSQQQADICQLIPIFFPLLSPNPWQRNKKLINQNGRKMHFKDSFQLETKLASFSFMLRNWKWFQLNYHVLKFTELDSTQRQIASQILSKSLSLALIYISPDGIQNVNLKTKMKNHSTDRWRGWK